MADETIGRATIQLGADGSKLAPEMAAAVAKAQGALDRANKQMERAQAQTVRAIQGHIDKINATRPTHEMRLLEQAVLKLGGSSKLSGDQLKRVTLEVNALAAAGAKVPASLQGLTGIGSKLGAAFQSLTTGGGVSGALAAIGPSGVAAAGALGIVTVAGTKAFTAIKDLAAEAEQWSNTAARTGLGVTQVQQLSILLEDAGIPAEALSGAMKELQKQIQTGGKELEKFGIDISKLKDLSLEEQLRAMAAQIAAIKDPAERTVVSLAAFGRSGVELLPVMDEVASGADKMFQALNPEQINSLKEADAQLDRFGQKWTFTWKTWAANAVGATGIVADFFKTGSFATPDAPKPPAPPKPGTNDEEEQRKKRAATFAARAASEAARKKAEDEAKQAAKQFQDLLDSLSGKKAQEQVDLIAKAFAKLGLSGIKDLEALRKQLESLEKQGAKISGGLLGVLKGGKLEVPKLDIGSIDLGPLGDLKNALEDSFVGAGLEAQQRFTAIANAARQAGIPIKDVERALKSAGASSEQTKVALDAASASTRRWNEILSGLSNGLALLGGALGGLWDKALSVLNNIKDSFKDWASLSGTGKFQAIAGAAGQLGSVVGGKGGGALAGAAGGALTGAAIGSIIPGIGTVIGGVIGGVVGGVAGFIGAGKAMKDAAEASKILGEHLSKEELKSIKQQAENEGKDWRTYLKERKAAEEKAREIEAYNKKREALLSAKGFAEALSDKIAAGGLSDKLTGALSAFVGKMGDALGKVGLGIVDARLKDSKEFQAASGVAGDVAGALGAAGQAGIVDAGLMAAASGAAEAIQQDAITAARAAGLSDMEAARQGSLAIAQILREQLHASIRSGNELDENTRRLLEEAKKNGIEIIADPMVESLGVQREILATLRGQGGKTGGDYYDGGGSAGSASGESGPPPSSGPSWDEMALYDPDAGVRKRKVQAASGFGPMITPNMGGGLGPLIQTHPGELAMVIPRSRVGQDGILSAAGGLYTDRAGSSGGTVVNYSLNVAPTLTPLSSVESQREAVVLVTSALGEIMRANNNRLIREIADAVRARL